MAKGLAGGAFARELAHLETAILNSEEHQVGGGCLGPGFRSASTGEENTAESGQFSHLSQITEDVNDYLNVPLLISDENRGKKETK